MTVYDCTMFLNENDLYEMRLNQHWDFVDKFIVLEAGETHTGLKKPYRFDKERFKKYEEKLVYVTFDSFADEMEKNPHLLDRLATANRGPNTVSEDWTRDHFQFNYLSKILIQDLGAKDDDIVYISCLDEIIKEEAFEACKPVFEDKTWVDSHGSRPILFFNLYLYAYKFNLLHRHWTDHVAGMLTEVGNFKKILPASIRSGYYHTHTIVENAGWHFTFLDPTDGELVLQKQKSWAHSRDARSGNAEGRYFDVETKEEAVRRFFINYTPKLVDITPETHPQYIIENLDKLQNFIYVPN